MSCFLSPPCFRVRLDSGILWWLVLHVRHILSPTWITWVIKSRSNHFWGSIPGSSGAAWDSTRDVIVLSVQCTTLVYWISFDQIKKEVHGCLEGPEVELRWLDFTQQTPSRPSLRDLWITYTVSRYCRHQIKVCEVVSFTLYKYLILI